MCNKCDNKQTMSTELFKAVYDSPVLLDKQPKPWQIMELTTIFTKTRSWFVREYTTRQLHPMVNDLLYTRGYGSTTHELREYITDWREMVLEWPHVAKSDPSRMAYTQSDEKGDRDLQTVTTLGKYLRRHMPDCPDHILRDFTARYIVDPNSCHITTDMEQMIRIVEEGPKSCMQGFDVEDHPYQVYDPKYGWGMAYRERDGKIIGRALVYHRDAGNTFVRSYKAIDEGRSPNDEALEAWLKNEGYHPHCDWHGCKLAKIETRSWRSNYLMPYLDGEANRVSDEGSYFVVDDEGAYIADQTNGMLNEYGRTCDDCGGTFDEDDMTWVDDHNCVCESCLESNYTYAYGGYGGDAQGYVRNEDVIFCESDEEYYDCDSYTLERYNIVLTEDDNLYWHIDDAWYCEGSGNWYSNKIDSYDIDGDFYAEDALPDGYEVVDGVLVDKTLPEAA